MLSGHGEVPAVRSIDFKFRRSPPGTTEFRLDDDMNLIAGRRDLSVATDRVNQLKALLIHPFLLRHLSRSIPHGGSEVVKTYPELLQQMMMVRPKDADKDITQSVAHEYQP